MSQSSFELRVGYGVLEHMGIIMSDRLKHGFKGGLKV